MPHPISHILLLCLALATATVHAETYRLQPFNARYSVQLNGFKVGELERKLHVESDGRHVLEHVMETTGLVALFKKDRLVERSIWSYAQGEARAQGYLAHYTGRARESVERLDFDWPRNVATSLYKDQTTELTLAAGMMDKLMHQMMLGSDIAAGRRELEYTLLDRGELKTYVYQRMGEEELATARGTVKTIKVKRKNTTIWLAPSWNYLLVQLIQKNDDGTIATYIQKQ